MEGTKKLSEKLLEVLNEEDMTKVSKYLVSKPIHDVVDTFISMVSNDDKLDKDDIYTLSLLLKIANKVYNYTGESTGISDSDYDMLVSFVNENLDKDLDITESIPNKDNNVVSHRYISLRGTLDKIYKITDEDVLKNKSQKSLDDWIKTCNNKLRAKGSNRSINDCDVIVMPKFDGVSCEFEYNKYGILIRALTRGDVKTNEAQDVTHIFKDIAAKGPFNASKYEYGLKTEIMMSEEHLSEYNEKYGTDYKSTRSIISSIMNSDEADERVDLIKIVPLRVSYMVDGEESRQYLAPEVYSYPYTKCKLSDLDEIHEFAFTHKYVNVDGKTRLRCDGAVIYINDEEIQDLLGREDNKQKYEVAFKFTEEVGYSKVEDIKFTTGLHGTCTPVCYFKPLKLKGNTVEKASLGSYARFKELQLSKGDTIKVLYDIIPYVMYDEKDEKCKRNKDHNPIKAPMVCPDCGMPLFESETLSTLTCVNDNCPCRIKGKILNYCQRLDIGRISYETIDTLYKLGYLRSIPDLYTLKNLRSELENINGFGKKSVDLMINSIESKKNISEATFIGALGITGIGPKKISTLLNEMSLEDVIYYAMNDMYLVYTVAEGFGDKMAKKLCDGIKENINTINMLLNELTLEKVEIKDAKYHVLFTKLSQKDIDEYKDFINSTGGVIDESIKKSTTSLVVCPNKYTTSTKISKAREWGIPVVTLADMKKYINDNFVD